ncbi:adenosylcobinamide-GDP ribazoletransferase [Rhodobacter capsulatus]|uniref:Adenosylcobinamide-GDP ribazoletransferase n=1 Tax=Rhodobacter capsulatus TaxID=1061 RepID=A0A4U1JS24_RHOCA|nr:adenosylcobinamide-GDP ribazoletransferase [Rhodobacter capsulatus]TKD21975.1 adenosylcobinamide-GDP ribazoletransferase [Rhodobacter capsulatus]
MERGWFRARLSEAHLAVLLLTRLPMPRLADPVPTLAQSVWAYPLAGLVVGAISALALAGTLALGLPPVLAAGLAVTLQVVITGALHEDGLADVADGFWGGREVTRRLEIMRDSRIGSYGVAALVLSLGLRWQGVAALAAASPALAMAGLIGLAILSRAACGVLMAALPAARPDGMGRYASGAAWKRVIAGGAVAMGAAFGLGLPVVPLLIVQGALVLGLAQVARAKIGGQTGDVLGTAQQLAEIGGWLVLAAAFA